MARVLIGTSGWHYASWRGPFFPTSLPLKQQLAYYASQFSTTELNGVFYRTPTIRAVKAWRDQTGENFTFAWKASKFITHWKRLSSKSDTSLELLESRIAHLGAKAGPILFQLPPNFKLDEFKLENFCHLLSKRRRYSFEFRDPSWYTASVFKVLANSTSLCAYPIIVMHRRLGGEPLILFISEDMVPPDGIRAIIQVRRSPNGLVG